MTASHQQAPRKLRAAALVASSIEWYDSLVSC